MKTYNLKIRRTIDQNDLDNILDAALQTCGYWCDELSVKVQPTEPGPYKAVSEIITRDGKLQFKLDEPFERNGKKLYILTENKLLWALEHYPFDFENYDSDEADALLQYALFQEVIYG
jgi:hypothetical protein